MLAELGHLSLLFALSLCLLATISGIYASFTKKADLICKIHPLYGWICVFNFLSLSLLAACFITDNFSVQYVAMHSNTKLDPFFKLAAVWGGHEGSFLFWLFALSFWAALVARRTPTYPREFGLNVMNTLGLLIIAISLFILLTSNPFERLFPAPLEGRDLNPMLQDIALIFHPPLLYIGYVGTAVGFAFAMAALLSPKTQWQWATWLRPWVISAWGFLTLGIMLGSWWAYYELGWGGFWFWDPVENASLMPWLASLALIHTLMIANHKKNLHIWSILLAISAFALSLLGTFIVRSGVLTSVHAFASDPTRGIALLGILSLVLIISLTLFGFKAQRYSNQQKVTYLSRSLLVMFGVSIITVGCAIVLLGTLYPMIFQAFDLGNISVGAPYFNFFFLPLTFIACLLIGLSYFTQHKNKRSYDKQQLMIASGITITITLFYGIYLYQDNDALLPNSFIPMMVGISASVWVLVTSYFYMLKFIAQQNYRGYAGMLAHAGIAISLIGICTVSFSSLETQQKMKPGSVVSFNDYQIKYQSTDLLIEDNYTAEQATLDLYSSDNERIGSLKPQKRHYTLRDMPMTEAAILKEGLSDWYITLGDKVDSQNYAVRIQYKPLSNLLWLGAYLMMLGAAAGFYHYLKAAANKAANTQPATHHIDDYKAKIHKTKKNQVKQIQGQRI